MSDSQAYRFAFLVRNEKDLPLDFRNSISTRGFEAALFLPRDHSDRFAKPKYIPHLLVLRGDDLQVVPHSKHQHEATTFKVSDLGYLERGQFLLSAWLGLVATPAQFKFPYPRREEGPVQEFMKMLISKLPQREISGSMHALSGSTAREVLRETIAEEFLSDETCRLEWYRCTARNGRFDLLAITNRRLVWATNLNEEDELEPYGYRLRCIPLRQLRGLRIDDQKIGVLLSKEEWQIPLLSSDDGIHVHRLAEAAQSLLPLDFLCNGQCNNT